jgi:toxin ParE1/3/4
MDELIIHRLAWREFRRAAAWYAARNAKAAVRFMEAAWKAIDEIVELPIAWPTADDVGHRYRLLRGYPYRIVYRWTPGTVLIVAITHLKRRPRSWARRR